MVAPPAVKKEVVSTEVPADEARKVPGTQGDVLKVVENLPASRARPSVRDQLVVWGAAPQDTRVYMDGVPLPTLYHQGGFRSVVHSDMVQSVELVPGGWSADYGRGIGGLVDVHLAPLEGEGTHGSVSADLLDASADVRAHLSDRVSVEVAGRQGYLDRVLPLFTSRNIGEYVPIPSYHDAQARAVVRIGPGETLEVGGMVSGDSVDDDVPSEDPTNVQTQSHTTSFERVWARWHKQNADGAEIVVVPSVGLDSDALVNQFGEVPTSLTVDSKMASLRASWHKRVGRLGHAIGRHRRAAHEQPLRSHGLEHVAAADGGAVRLRSAACRSGSARRRDHGLCQRGPILGCRLRARRRAHPPRAGAPRRAVPADGEPHGTASRHDAAGGSVRAVARGRAARGGPVESRALAHLEGGLGRLPRAARAGRPVVRLRQPDPRSRVGASPAMGIRGRLSRRRVGRDYCVRDDVEEPRRPEPPAVAARGAVARRHGHRPHARPSGARSQAARKAPLRLGDLHPLASERANADGQPYYPYDYDQTHVLSALASCDLGDGFVVGSRFRYATGYPRTPVTGDFFDVQTGLYEPFFGALNSTRIPPFIQWDIRLAKTFAIGKTSLETYLDVQNVTDRANPEEIVYSLDYTQRHYITGLPLLPVAGARLAW